MNPAWSEDFDAGRLGNAPSLGAGVTIDRQWAFGGSSGAGVKVAIIDSGVDSAHRLVGSVAGGAILTADESAGDGVRLEERPHDDLYGHGTACAGIIRSIAPDVALYSVRVLSERLTGKAFVFAAGVEWALDRGMDIVNLSLSTTNEAYTEQFFSLADRAIRQRAVLVSAMNNEREVSIPSEYASVFSVAATDRVPRYDTSGTDGFLAGPLLLANPSPPADFGAPGVELEVPWLDGATVTTTGNSFAVPHIAGLVARLLAKHPGLTPWQVKTVLAAVADNAPTR